MRTNGLLYQVHLRQVGRLTLTLEKTPWNPEPSKELNLLIEALEISIDALTKYAHEVALQQVQNVTPYTPTLDDWPPDNE